MFHLTITKADDKGQEIAEYNVFAWLSWPTDLISTALRELGETMQLAITGSCVVLTRKWVKEIFVPARCANNPPSHHITKGAMLTPFRKTTRYEDRTDYLNAVQDGAGSPMVSHGEARRCFKSDR